MTKVFSAYAMPGGAGAAARAVPVPVT